MRRDIVGFCLLTFVFMAAMICSCDDEPLGPSGEAGPAWAAWNDPLAISYQLTAMWGESVDDLYVVGRNEIVLHLAGGEWTILHSGGESTLNDVWSSSSGEIFAVGAGGMILHFDGRDWKRMESPAVSDLNGVWGRSESEVYAVGTEGVVLLYDGSAWRLLGSGTDRCLRDVWGDADRAFAVGDGGTLLELSASGALAVDTGTTNDLHAAGGNESTGLCAVGSTGTIIVHDGSEWRGVRSGTILDFERVHVTPGGIVLLIYESGVLSSDGPGWDALNFELVLRSTDAVDVWAASPGDVFLLEWNGVVHFDGMTTSPMVVNGAQNVNDLRHVWGFAEDDVYAARGDGIQRYDGNGWTLMEYSPSRYAALWGVSATEILAANIYIDYGHPPRIPPRYSTHIYQCDGEAWSYGQQLTNVGFNDIGGAASGGLFAVGHSAEAVLLEGYAYFRLFPRVFRFDGESWIVDYSSASDGSLSAVWVRSATDAYAVGDGGLILRRDGSGWSEMDSGTSADLTAVWGDADSVVMAAGDLGTILRNEGSGWIAMESGTEETIHGLWGASSDDVHAVCAGGVIIHFDGTLWSEMASPTVNDLYDIWGAAPDDIFAVGRYGTILHYGP